MNNSNAADLGNLISGLTSPASAHHRLEHLHETYDKLAVVEIGVHQETIASRNSSSDENSHGDSSVTAPEHCAVRSPGLKIIR
jgi:hypothetical protein